MPVSRHDIAGIWVAFFQECQPHRCDRMHFFRTGLDIRPTHGSVLKGMESVRRYNEQGLTGPGCWAHADMLAVGVTVPQPPGALHRRRKRLPSLGCVVTPIALRCSACPVAELWCKRNALALSFAGAKHHCATATTPCSLNVTEMRSNFGKDIG